MTIAVDWEDKLSKATSMFLYCSNTADDTHSDIDLTRYQSAMMVKLNQQAGKYPWALIWANTAIPKETIKFNSLSFILGKTAKTVK